MLAIYIYTIYYVAISCLASILYTSRMATTTIAIILLLSLPPGPAEQLAPAHPGPQPGPGPLASAHPGPAEGQLAHAHPPPAQKQLAQAHPGPAEGQLAQAHSGSAEAKQPDLASLLPVLLQSLLGAGPLAGKAWVCSNLLGIGAAWGSLLQPASQESQPFPHPASNPLDLPRP